MIRSDARDTAIRKNISLIIKGALRSGKHEIIDAYAAVICEEWRTIHLGELVSAGMADYCVTALDNNYPMISSSNYKDFIIAAIESRSEDCLRKAYGLKTHPEILKRNWADMFDFPDDTLDRAAREGNTLVLETLCELADKDGINLLLTQKTLGEAVKSGNLCMVLAILDLAKRYNVVVQLNAETILHSAGSNLSDALKKLAESLGGESVRRVGRVD